MRIGPIHPPLNTGDNVNRPFRIVNSILCLIATFIVLGSTLTPAQETKEDTYDITLIKTAETDAAPGTEREIMVVSGRRVLTEHHSVKEGEWVWKILRERKLLEKRNLGEILDILKRLNPELSDLNHIHPGQKILIPLTLSPAEGVHTPGPPSEPVRVTLEELKDIELQRYTVQPGDDLVKIINRQYEAPDAAFYEKYLSAVRRLNPSVRDFNRIYPGQVIRLPVFTPELVRMPIESREPDELLHHQVMPELTMDPPPERAVRISPPSEETVDPLRDDLGRLFRALGEEWIQHGQHYIPLKSRGEVNLRADAYPMINLSNGRKVIVDLHNTLPGDMASLLEKTWDHYRIVHLLEGDDLAGALDRILPECDLGTILGKEETMDLDGAIQVKLTADWILRTRSETLMITIRDKNMPPVPGPVREYLARQGVRVIDFPPARMGEDTLPEAQPVINAGPGMSSLVETLLKLNGLDFMRNVEIPIYEKREGVDFNLFIRADYLLEKDGRKFMLDLSGVGSNIMTLLRERELSYLSLAGENDPLRVMTRLLRFLGTPFEPGPLDVMAAGREERHNIRFRIPGASFRDGAGRLFLATTLDPPREICRLITEKGYHILRLSPV